MQELINILGAFAVLMLSREIRRLRTRVAKIEARTEEAKCLEP